MSVLWGAMLFEPIGRPEDHAPAGRDVDDVPDPFGIERPSASEKKLSPIVTIDVDLTRLALSPQASAGTPTAAMTAHANHGKYLFLIPRIPLR